jgi:hypothetical protein
MIDEGEGLVEEDWVEGQLAGVVGGVEGLGDGGAF